MGTFTLNMSANATNAGEGDVTGYVKRSGFQINTDYTFGSAYTKIRFTTAVSLPTDITCKITIGTTAGWSDWSPLGKVNRYYSFAKTGTSTDKVDLTYRYLTGELDGTDNVETKLVVWHQNIHAADPNPHEHGKTSQDLTHHTISFNNISLNSLASSSNPDDNQWTTAYSLSEKNTWRPYGSSASTEWAEPLNWSSGHYPGQSGFTTDDVLIPAGYTAYPVLSSNVELKSLEIEAQGTSGDIPSITANSYLMTVNGSSGAWINNGTFFPGNGKVIFNHGVPDEIATIAGSTDFYNIEVGPNSTLQPVAGNYLSIAGVGSAYATSIVDFSTVNNTVE
ncbi:MAG: hypothetical protein LC658_14435, partial [Bacteroidales bacterium]|nr:hypothetical protein [Bacteroidales bacterium]